MKIKNFEDLEIWKESKEIVVKIFKITNNIKFKYDLRFKDQIRRSAISIPSNISEGFERNNNNEFVYFFKNCKRFFIRVDYSIKNSMRNWIFIKRRC